METTLHIFSNNPYSHAFLVCTAASTQHPETRIHFLTGLQVLEDTSHPLRHVIITWNEDIVEAKITSAVAFNTNWLIPGNLPLLTNIVEFNSTVLAVEPKQVLVPSPSGSAHTRKQIYIPDAAYGAPHTLPPLLCGDEPITLADVRRIMLIRDRNLN